MHFMPLLLLHLMVIVMAKYAVLPPHSSTLGASLILSLGRQIVATDIVALVSEGVFECVLHDAL